MLSLLLTRLASTLHTICMSIHKSTPATKTARMSATALGMLVCAIAHLTPGAASEFRDASPAGAPLYGDFREARGIAGPTPDLSAAVDASVSDPRARLHDAFASDPGLAGDRARQAEREVLVRNSDALVRAQVRLALGKERRGFLYADIGAVDSALKWQGLAGIPCGHGVDLLGGWRRVTYHFSPGQGFDSLDFNGPFLGATLAW